MNWPVLTATLAGAFFWEIIGWLKLTEFLPRLSTVIASLAPMIETGELQQNLSLSLIALVEGFGAAIFMGISVGVSMGLSWRVKAVLDPYVNAFLAAPSAAFVPLMVVFFGLGRGACGCDNLYLFLLGHHC